MTKTPARERRKIRCEALLKPVSYIETTESKKEMMNSQLTQKRKEIMGIASKYGIHNIRIFGSTARGDNKNDSDIDLLVDIEEGRDLFDMGAFLIDLETLLQKKIDVVTENALHQNIRQTVLKEAIPL
jgi:predicted nucleotidyltransferase